MSSTSALQPLRFTDPVVKFPRRDVRIPGRWGMAATNAAGFRERKQGAGPMSQTDVDVTQVQDPAAQGTGSQRSASPVPARRSGTQPGHRSELATELGKTSIADSVVAKISGLACREVAGVHDMGRGAARTLGAIKEKLPIGSSDPAPARGVNVE